MPTGSALLLGAVFGHLPRVPPTVVALQLP